MAVLCGANAAAAQEAGGFTVFGFNVNASVKAQAEPTYEGSDDYKVGPSGSISFTRPGAEHVFSAPDDGISITLAGSGVLTAGLNGRLVGRRDNDDDLRGLRKVDWAGEAGVFVNFWPADWLRTRVAVRKAFGGHDGVVADLGADMVGRSGPWEISVGPRLSYADEEFIRTYFGVTPAEALASPFIKAAYSPSGGARYAGVQAAANYQLTSRWLVTVDASYQRVLGDAADSPIVRQLGSENQYRASAGVRYTFGG